MLSELPWTARKIPLEDNVEILAYHPPSKTYAFGSVRQADLDDGEYHGDGEDADSGEDGELDAPHTGQTGMTTQADMSLY